MEGVISYDVNIGDFIIPNIQGFTKKATARNYIGEIMVDTTEGNVVRWIHKSIKFSTIFKKLCR